MIHPSHGLLEAIGFWRPGSVGIVYRGGTRNTQKTNIEACRAAQVVTVVINTAPTAVYEEQDIRGDRRTHVPLVEDRSPGRWLEQVAETMPPLVVATVANFGCADTGLVENWHQSLTHVGLAENALIAALDPDAHALLTAQGVPSVRWNARLWPRPPMDAMDRSEEGWEQLECSMLELVRTLLGLGKCVLFSDADLVFLRNPLPILEDLQGGIQLQADCEAAVDLPGCESLTHSGLCFVRPTERTRKVIDYATVHLSPRGIEEAFSDHEAPDGDAGQLRILPRALFPSSKFWESRRPRSAYAVSYKSFPTVEEKIVRMVEDHAWLPFFHDCLKRRIRPDSRYRMTLRDWQAYPFPRAEIIFQASPMDGSDSMVPYPVGMHWRYWAQKQDCNRRFARNRHCLLKLNPDTDKRRHHLPVNRPAILAMLGDRFE